MEKLKSRLAISAAAGVIFLIFQILIYYSSGMPKEPTELMIINGFICMFMFIWTLYNGIRLSQAIDKEFPKANDDEENDDYELFR